MTVLDMSGYKLAPKQLETAAQVREAAARVMQVRKAGRSIPVYVAPARELSVLELSKWPDWVNDFVHGATLTKESANNVIMAAFPVVRPFIVHRQHPRLEDIIRIVSVFYGWSGTDIISHRRTAKLVQVRQVAMFLSKTLTLRSLPEIGRQFGGRDHTTVLHAVRKIERLTADGGRLCDECQLLRMAVSEHLAECNLEVHPVI